MVHHGTVESGNKWTIWDVKWDNYIDFMVKASSIPFDYVMCRYKPVGWTVANERDYKKYQAIHIGLAW